MARTLDLAYVQIASRGCELKGLHKDQVDLQILRTFSLEIGSTVFCLGSSSPALDISGYPRGLGLATHIEIKSLVLQHRLTVRQAGQGDP